MPTPSRHLYLALAITAIFIGCQRSGKTTENKLNNDTDIVTKTMKDAINMKEVSGQFEVKITPTETDDSKLGLMQLDKTYRGPLEATGIGRMLTGMTDIQGSAGYVAIEKISGSLEGDKGSFLIQHSGIQQGEPKSLSIQVIPDSGTSDLTGIEGTMDINITDSGHKYVFRYSLPRHDDQ